VVLREGKCNFNLEYWCDDTDRGKLSVQNNPISAPNGPIEIPRGMAWVRSWNFVVRDLRVMA